MSCRHKLYHFMVANLVLVKRVFATVKWYYNLCRQIIQTQIVLSPFYNVIHSDKTLFQNVFVTLLRRVAKDVTSSLLSWHKRYDFNAANFRRHSQWKCALQMKWIRINVKPKMFSKVTYIYQKNPSINVVGFSPIIWSIYYACDLLPTK